MPATTMFGDTVDVAPQPGMGLKTTMFGDPVEGQSTVPPGVPKPPLPEGLAPGTGPGEENSAGGAGNEPGLPAIVNQGVHQLGRAFPAFANNRPAVGVSDVIKGGAKTLSPLAIPSIATAPAATFGGAILGGAGHVLGKGVADAFHASPETSEAIGDVTSLPAGYFGSAAGTRLTSIPRGNWVNAASDLPYGIGTMVKAGRRLFDTPMTTPPVNTAPSGPGPVAPLHWVDPPPYDPSIRPLHWTPAPWENPTGPRIDPLYHTESAPEVAPSPIQPAPKGSTLAPRGWSGTISPGGELRFGASKSVPPSGSWGEAPKTTAAQLPELMRQQRLAAGDTSSPISAILDAKGNPINRGSR